VGFDGFDCFFLFVVGGARDKLGSTLFTLEQQEQNLDEETSRTTTGDHKTHSRSRKNKTGNWKRNR
jgi:hypothetical protein